MDIGGHRFFSKADRVMNWWTELMPVATDGGSSEQTIQYQNRQRNVGHVGRRDGGSGPGDAGAPAQEPHLFLAQLL